MNTNRQQDLESTRNLLAGSLQLHATEQAPSAPHDLLDELTQRFSASQSSVLPVRSRSWLASVLSFISRPSFGIASLAMVILGISLPSLTQPKSAPIGSGFRGSVIAATDVPKFQVVLIQAPSEIQSALENSSEFEDNTLFSSLSKEVKATGAKILVDFTTSTIRAVNVSNEQVYEAPLPAATNEILNAIVTAATRL